VAPQKYDYDKIIKPYSRLGTVSRTQKKHQKPIAYDLEIQQGFKGFRGKCACKIS